MNSFEVLQKVGEERTTQGLKTKIRAARAEESEGPALVPESPSSPLQYTRSEAEALIAEGYTVVKSHSRNVARIPEDPTPVHTKVNEGPVEAQLERSHEGKRRRILWLTSAAAITCTAFLCRRLLHY